MLESQAWSSSSPAFLGKRHYPGSHSLLSGEEWPAPLREGNCALLSKGHYDGGKGGEGGVITQVGSGSEWHC